MTLQKQSLHEVAETVDSHKLARSEPINQVIPSRSMDFIRSLVLDMPMQVYKETPPREDMNIEKIIEAQLDAEANKMSSDQKDHVSFDIPLLIRILEHAREDINSDAELHNFVEKIIDIREKGVLTMNDYEIIAGNSIQQQQDESIDFLKKLAGIR